MAKYGEAPYLECSSRGDKQFSAFFARIKARGNRSIEELYQAYKILPDGRTNLHWREAKGQKPINEEEAARFYDDLWIEYLEENWHLIEVLVQATGLSDQFAKQTSLVNQAKTLWGLRERIIAQSNPKT